jgi:hypothetical protein
MGTKRFGGGSVRSNQDFYLNTNETDLTSLSNDKKVEPFNPLFHFGSKCECGGATAKSVVSQLRFIAKELETAIKEKRIANPVFYSVDIQEQRGKL